MVPRSAQGDGQALHPRAAPPMWRRDLNPILRYCYAKNYHPELQQYVMGDHR